MNHVIRIGKKYAVYLPRKLVDELHLKEGDVLLVKVEEGKLLLKPIRRTVEFWSRIKPEEVEEVGEELTKRLLE
jgi:AbrB family looped-hinge helix DNA binding protein